MTRPGRTPRRQALAGLLASDAEAAVLLVLQEANVTLTAGEIKGALRAGGVARADADRSWPRVQRRIPSHAHVIVEGNRYGWTTQPRAVSAPEALDLIVKGRPAAPRKAELVAIVGNALSSSPVDFEAATRLEQTEVEGVRALAELASEVEELSVNEASSAAMIHRVRARAKRSGLEPVDRAGQETMFDRKRHQPIGPPIREGSPVVVVRPGYVWKKPTGDVLIAKAIVEE